MDSRTNQQARARSHKDAGIAIGPILFVIALLGIIAVAMSSSMSGFSSAGVADRIAADVSTQANLIRSKIMECNLKYGNFNNNVGANDGYPETPSGALVADLICSGDAVGSQNLWTGMRATQLPPPSSGLSAWKYANDGDSGGRCFYVTAPHSTGIADGLRRAASKFSGQEASFDPNASTLKFIVFLTLPTGPASACAQ